MATRLADVIDVPAFKSELQMYMRRSFVDLRAAYPNEEFYWFGPYTASDAIESLADSAAGRDAVNKLVASLVHEHPWSEWSPTERVGAARWMCADLPYHCFGSDRGHDAKVNNLLRPWSEYLFGNKNDADEVKDRIHDELRLTIDEALKQFKESEQLGDVLILLTGGDVNWRLCAESAVRINGEAFCRERYPDLFEQY
jgi:hypothetical protein